MDKNTDGITAPDCSATQIRAAIKHVTDHAEGKNVHPSDFTNSMSILREAEANQNWVVYVP